MNGKHISNELDIFEATEERTKNIKLLPNSDSIESERTEHD